MKNLDKRNEQVETEKENSEALKILLSAAPIYHLITPSSSVKMSEAVKEFLEIQQSELSFTEAENLVLNTVVARLQGIGLEIDSEADEDPEYDDL